MAVALAALAALADVDLAVLALEDKRNPRLKPWIFCFYSSRNCDMFSEYFLHLSISDCMSDGSSESKRTICLVRGWTNPSVLACRA